MPEPTGEWFYVEELDLAQSVLPPLTGLECLNSDPRLTPWATDCRASGAKTQIPDSASLTSRPHCLDPGLLVASPPGL